MRKYGLWIGLGIVMVIWAGIVIGLALWQYNAKKDIRQLYADYDRALTANDGHAAARLVGSATFDWYEDVLRRARSATRAELERESLMHQVVILRLRHEFSRSELEKMTGRDVFRIGVERHWLDDSRRPSSERIAVISVDNDHASVSFNPLPDTPAWFLIKEDGTWKMDAALMLKALDKGLSKEIAESGKSIDLLMYLEVFQKKVPDPVDPAILDGPIDR